MNVKDWIASALIFLAFAGGWHLNGSLYEKKISEYKLEAEKQYSELLQQKLESDKRNSARVAQAELEGLQALEELKVNHEKTIADLRNNFKPSGVSKCPEHGDGVSRTDPSTAELVCYSRAELQSKIDRSMAITREADELAVKYNTLLKIFNEGKK